MPAILGSRSKADICKDKNTLIYFKYFWHNAFKGTEPSPLLEIWGENLFYCVGFLGAFEASEMLTVSRNMLNNLNPRQGHLVDKVLSKF